MDFEQDSLLKFLATTFGNPNAAAYRKVYRNMSMMNQT